MEEIDPMIIDNIYDKKIFARSWYRITIISIVIFLVLFPFPLGHSQATPLEHDERMILVTGFGPWHIHEINPSGLVALALNNITIDPYRIIGLELSVDFKESTDQMISAISVYEPDLIVSLGLAAKATNIRIETLSLNIQFDSLSEKPLKSIKRIQPEGPFFFQTTLDMAASLLAMNQKAPTVKSYSAGLYICNSLFYQTQHYLHHHNMDTPMGFIHIPQISPIAPEGLDLETIIDAIYACICVNLDR
ncbi:MAG: pyroglutamyl-peptidase I [Candidatus Thermoplasmatota archaeon]|nr:pyroglutamyl-peptidase I [Candidatus Thermoplasmatota archaeon]